MKKIPQGFSNMWQGVGSCGMGWRRVTTEGHMAGGSGGDMSHCLGTCGRVWGHVAGVVACGRVWAHVAVHGGM